MTALTSMLVRDRAVPVRKIEEALERQVVSGGDLETALLELDALPEDVLAAYHAGTFGLLPGTRKEVMGPPEDVLRLVPREVAEQHGLVPLRTEDRVLVAAVAAPPSPEQDQRLGYALGYDLVYRLVLPARLALALSRHYGTAVDDRLTRLGERLDARDPGVPTYVAPPNQGLRGPETPLLQPAPAGAERARRVDPLADVPERVAEPTLVDAPAPAAALAPTAPGERRRPREAPRLPTGSILQADLAAVALAGREPPSAPPGPPSDAPLRVPFESLRRRRGPLGYEEAVDLLGDAAQRDEVLAVLFAYARQFFDYSALFVVADGELVGRDAKGPGASAAVVSGIRLTPAHGGTVAAVVESGAPACVDLELQERDRELVQRLGRSGRQPAALVPATVRRRSVLVLYGDQGGDPMILGDLGRLLAILPRVTEAFERLILRRKQGGARSRRPPAPSGGPPSSPPAARPGRDTRLGAADTEPAPPPRMSPLPPGPGGAPRRRGSVPPAVDPRPTHPPSRRPAVPGPVSGDTRRLPVVPGRDEPSVIVDMGEQVEALVERLVTFGPEDADTALDGLLRVGEAALPVLVRHFPGPLWFHRAVPHRKLPRGRDVSAIARALVAFEAEAVPYLASRIADPRADVRFYATLVSSEHMDTRLLPALVPRIFDEDEGVRGLALRVLTLYRRFPDAIGRALHPVRAEARVPRKGGSPERRRFAVEALGELRDRRSLDLLVDLLDDEGMRDVAHPALVALTQHDFGTSSRRWLSWTEKQAGRHRIEWLIDALLHADEALRAAAGDELQQLTQQYLGFHAGLPRRDREIAHKKYVAWWEQEGRRLWAG